jgi:hypothetical protein
MGNVWQQIFKYLKELELALMHIVNQILYQCEKMCTRLNFVKRGCEISIKCYNNLEKKWILTKESMIGIADEWKREKRRNEWEGSGQNWKWRKCGFFVSLSKSTN